MRINRLRLGLLIASGVVAVAAAPVFVCGLCLGISLMTLIGGGAVFLSVYLASYAHFGSL